MSQGHTIDWSLKDDEPRTAATIRLKEISDDDTRHDAEAIRAFFNEVTIYDVLVANDYMAHTGIHRALRENLSGLKEPFSIIDLGCGDASRIAGTLQGLPVRDYFGVDLSSVALRRAEENMSTVAGTLSFFEDDLIAFLNSGKTEPVDVIVAGFAAHHLNEPDKRRLLRLCMRNLKQDGALYYYDVFRRTGETRETYLEAYLSNLDRTWTALTPEERGQVKDHILACDRPETYETIAALASATGFTVAAEPLYEDDLRFHRLYRFTH